MKPGQLVRNKHSQNLGRLKSQRQNIQLEYGIECDTMSAN